MATRPEFPLSEYLASAGSTDAFLDEKIVEAVRAGAGVVNAIHAALGVDRKEVVERGKTPMWRRVERRLQWLRNHGFLSFNRNKGWKPLDPRKSSGAT